ncbi:MAG: T9SS type A sorting domain-containing protein, partial [Bacteroidota bacterium]
DNPGNFGAEITSAENMGLTTIRRGHVNNITPLGNSVLRYYIITPTNNSSLNATLRAYYFDHELNGVGEGDLDLWRNDGASWEQQFAAASNTTSNYVEKTAMADFSSHTLSLSQPLAAEIADFTLDCREGIAHLEWVAAGEHRGTTFVIEKSPDNQNWAVLDSIADQDQGEPLTLYTYQNEVGFFSPTYYRLGQYDLQNSLKYHQTVSAACQTEGRILINAYPNPTEGATTVEVNEVALQMGARVDVISGLGRSIMSSTKMTARKMDLDLSNSPSGVYYVRVRLANGKSQTLKVIRK